MDDDWDDLLHDLTLDLAGLGFRQFVVVEFYARIDPDPYAQATPSPDGDWHCEVVSERYLPNAMWPIDELALMSMGWEPPSRPDDNWSHNAPDSAAAAATLVDALRLGRGCGDPLLFDWRTGRFPPPPDDPRDHASAPPGPFGLAV